MGEGFRIWRKQIATLYLQDMRDHSSSSTCFSSRSWAFRHRQRISIVIVFFIPCHHTIWRTIAKRTKHSLFFSMRKKKKDRECSLFVILSNVKGSSLSRIQFSILSNRCSRECFFFLFPSGFLQIIILDRLFFLFHGTLLISFTLSNFGYQKLLGNNTISACYQIISLPHMNITALGFYWDSLGPESI